LNEKASFQGIVATFDLVSPRKISQILPVFQYNSSISNQSHDILANYVASSVQWYKCYGTLRPRGNTKKYKTPDEMISKTQLKDSDYSDDGSDFTVGDRSSRRHKTHEPKQEKHQMTSRQDSATAKKSKNDSFEYVDFSVNYESPPEDFGDTTDEKQRYSSPRAMKSDSQSKVKLKDQDFGAPKKETTPEWVLHLMSSVKRLEQKVDNTMDEVDALKKKETAKHEIQALIKSEKSENEINVDLTEN
jgi:hypothetical protein